MAKGCAIRASREIKGLIVQVANPLKGGLPSIKRMNHALTQFRFPTLNNGHGETVLYPVTKRVGSECSSSWEHLKNFRFCHKTMSSFAHNFLPVKVRFFPSSGEISMLISCDKWNL
ncbi:hypothetical protein CEXT_703061 [Caerostris extrusa]|uniref:Uncharacterized protein n=1 Tax=Caerostris extrusa TaxID=172846 RepID=A0AAV4XWW8_CAEEX|nr:hypothetical protein CEXT_703061 [Caerostris extrusa]